MYPISSAEFVAYHGINLHGVFLFGHPKPVSLLARQKRNGVWKRLLKQICFRASNARPYGVDGETARLYILGSPFGRAVSEAD